MTDFMKSLKVKNSTTNKVLTTDANGIIKSTDIDVNNIASKEETSNLSARIDNLETVTADMGTRLQNLNG